MDYGDKKTLTNLINEALESEKRTRQVMSALTDIEHSDMSEMTDALEESAGVFNAFSKRLVADYNEIKNAGLLDSLYFVDLEENTPEAVSLRAIRVIDDGYEISANVSGAYVSGDFRDFDLRIMVDKDTHEFSSAFFSEKTTKVDNMIFCRASIKNTTGAHAGALVPVLCDFLEKQTPAKASVLSKQFLSKIVEKNEKIAEELEAQLSVAEKVSKTAEVERSDRV